MDTKDMKTIGLSAVLTMLLIVGADISGIDLNSESAIEEPMFICEAQPEKGIFSCDGFSKYVDIKGRCINARQDGVTYSSKICKTGWSLITDDMVIEDEPEYDMPIYEVNNERSKCNTADGREWICYPFS